MVKSIKIFTRSVWKSELQKIHYNNFGISLDIMVLCLYGHVIRVSFVEEKDEGCMRN